MLYAANSPLYSLNMCKKKGKGGREGKGKRGRERKGSEREVERRGKEGHWRELGRDV